MIQNGHCCPEANCLTIVFGGNLQKRAAPGKVLGGRDVEVVTVGASALFACAAVLASSVMSASAMVRIGEDRGGQIGHYKKTFAMFRSSGERVVVDGNCLSACTLV